jgi:hypothetical protein
MKKGAHLLKCGKRGKPKFCAFRLSSVSNSAWLPVDTPLLFMILPLSLLLLLPMTPDCKKRAFIPDCCSYSEDVVDFMTHEQKKLIYFGIA